MPACEHGQVSVTQLVTPGDVPVLAELLRASRHFLAPWEPIWGEDYFTADGQRAIIRDQEARTSAGWRLAGDRRSRNGSG
jgi:ribosomal-protein-alanine N-acetyltransferase